MQTSFASADRTATAREIMDSLWDLECMHREMIEQMKRLLETFDAPPDLDM